MSTIEIIILSAFGGVVVTILACFIGITLIAEKYSRRRKKAASNEFIKHFEEERTDIFNERILLDRLKVLYGDRLEALKNESLFLPENSLVEQKELVKATWEEISLKRAKLIKRVKELLAYCEEHRKELLYFYPAEVAAIYLDRQIKIADKGE